MLDSTTKRRIDTARNILVGKVPDPKSQVEQITIALIYKFMDDMDADSEEMGGQRTFFAGDYERYGWAKLMRAGLGGFETLNLYSEAIQKMPDNPGIQPFFREIFKDALLPYRDPETLKSFLKIIDEFTYDHSEKLGDAFEYLLSVLGSQGENGQFRTPRHIIDFMVEILAPKKSETVLDPACGTAGFLVSAYKHILGTNVDTSGQSTLSPDDRARLAANFKGYDITPDMVRLSLVNLYLHGFPDPHVFEYDTLGAEDRWNEAADVILANPPFMTPKGGAKPHKKFSVASNRTEVLFLDYVLEHLTTRGRAAIVVPEGIHFVSHGGHVQLRKILLEQKILKVDITLPHGVFKPYASVKTHILIIDKDKKTLSDDVLFIEIENDGYTQGDTREVVTGSQLNSAVLHARTFIQACQSGAKWKQPDNKVRSYCVTYNKLLTTNNLHILGRWHDLPNRVLHRGDTPLMTIGDLCEVRQGLSPNMATPPGQFVLVVPAEDRKSADHFDYIGPAVCVPLVSAAGHGKADIKRLHYQEGEFALATTMCALFVKNTKVLNPKFLFLYLNEMASEILVPLMCGATNVTLDSEQLNEILVPVPSLATQNEIVEAQVIKDKSTILIREADALMESSKHSDVQTIARKIRALSISLQNPSEVFSTVSDFLPRSRAI